MSGLLLDFWHWTHREPQLVIDMKRVNVELRKETLVGLEDDVAYRNRVKQRMRDGKGCTYPPLIDRKKVLPFAAPLRGDGRISVAESSIGPLADAG